MKKNLTLKAFKKELKKFATKKDLQRFATKEDLGKLDHKVNRIALEVIKHTESINETKEITERTDRNVNLILNRMI